MSEVAFIQDLAMLMAVAGGVALFFARQKWPKAIGYILAGVLLSRHTWSGLSLADESSVQTIGQLGVIFLMFTMGLEFSTSDMKRMKNVTLPTAILDTVIMTWLGYTVGRSVFGWGTVASLFLGAAVCDSSTTLLAKIIDEMKWSDRPFAKYVVGTSVCEDVICVGIIALITGVANGMGMSIGAVGMSLGGLLTFFLATIVFGLILVPRLLVSVAKRGDDEALLLTVLGCCFFVTYVAFRLDYSLALGAFLVGILGSGSDVRRRLRKMVEPLKTMFAAVFFVSIGLLVNPAECFRHLPQILLLSGLVLAGKTLNCFTGALFAGESLKTSVQMGFGLAQIGEFAYMVAMLYITTTRDTSSPMYQIVVGVSLLTTILNPLMLRLSEPVGSWAEAKCPARVKGVLDSYRGFLLKYRTAGGGTAARRTVRACALELAVIGVLEFAVAFALSLLNGRDWTGFPAFFVEHRRFVFCLAANVFIVSMLAPVVKIAFTLGSAVAETLVGKGEAGWQLAVHHVVRLTVLVTVLGLYGLELAMINVNLAPEETWARVSIMAVFGLAGVLGWKFFLRAAARASQRFDEALKVDERLARLSREVKSTFVDDSVVRLTVPEGSPAVGATVVTLNVRARTGATVVAVERAGEKTVRRPGPSFAFAAGDVLVVSGDGSEVAALGKLLEAAE